ncbi:unnamed protein product [Bathycoccus prasinos]
MSKSDSFATSNMTLCSVSAWSISSAFSDIPSTSNGFVSGPAYRSRPNEADANGTFCTEVAVKGVPVILPPAFFCFPSKLRARLFSPSSEDAPATVSASSCPTSNLVSSSVCSSSEIVTPSSAANSASSSFSSIISSFNSSTASFKSSFASCNSSFASSCSACCSSVCCTLSVCAAVVPAGFV